MSTSTRSGRALQLQLIFKRACQLTEGRCVFVNGQHPTEEDVLLEAEPCTLLWQGAKATGSQAAVEACLPPPAATLSRLKP